MMKGALLKDFLREIGKTLNRFLSIFCIVMIGVAFFIGVKATAPDMRHTADKYYDDYNMMDISVMSTLGITQGDVDAILALEGVHQVQPAYSTDVLTRVNSTEVVLKVHSLPIAYMSDPGGDFINKVQVVEGRLPQKSGECVLEQPNNVDFGIYVGDEITVSSGTDISVTDENDGALKRDTFKVVGRVVTPYYMTFDKGTAAIGAGKINTYIMIPEEDFGFPVYTEAFITLSNAQGLDSFSNKYKSLLADALNDIENLGIDRCQVRVSEIREMATDYMNQSKEEYTRNETRYNREIADAEAELAQANEDLVSGEALLRAGEETFNMQVEQAEKSIADGKRSVAQGESQLASVRSQYNSLMSQNQDMLNMLDNASSSMDSANSSIKDAQNSINTALNNPDLDPEVRSQYESLSGVINSLGNASSSLGGSMGNISGSAKSAISAAQSQIASIEKQLADAKREIAEGEAKLAQEKLDFAQMKAEKELELEEGKKKYNQGVQELQASKLAGQKQLNAGREQLLRAEMEIEKLAEPIWYVLDRNANLSYVNYNMMSDRIDSIAQIFPVFFFVVAALICSTTMTRMVDEQRGTIGAYKALGYSNSAIAFKYVVYAALASVLGGVLGLFIGMSFLPKAIFESFTMLYTIPPLSVVNQIPLMILSVLAGVLVTVLAAYFACRTELVGTPSLLMRPKPPKQGKAIFLEKVTFIWKSLSFSQKVTMRNLFRYKKRFWMTVIGIAGCSALLLSGLGLHDTISQVVDKQFGEIFQHDLELVYAKTATDIGKDGVKDIIAQQENIKSYIDVSQTSVKFYGKNETMTVTLVVPQTAESFGEYVRLRNRTNGNEFALPEIGIVISEKLSKEMGVRVGDMVQVTNAYGLSKKIMVSAITENYIFHYAYMTPEYYEEIYRTPSVTNALMLKLNVPDAPGNDELGSLLIANENVDSAVFFSTFASTFEDQVESLNSIVVLIVVFAGLLAFVVLYNLTNINISERIREIATIKVLGFHNNEVTSYVYRENIILTIIGGALGLGVGIVLHRFVMEAIEQAEIMFGNVINWQSFIYAFTLTVVFSLLVSMFMRKRLINIQMVESLKSIE